MAWTFSSSAERRFASLLTPAGVSNRCVLSGYVADYSSCALSLLTLACERLASVVDDSRLHGQRLTIQSTVAERSLPRGITVRNVLPDNTSRGADPPYLRSTRSAPLLYRAETDPPRV